MRVWFMYDCHLFAKVGDGSASRTAMEAKARELFAEDGCGSLFVRDGLDRSVNVWLTGRPLAGGGYGVTESELKLFFDRVEERANWEARG